MKKLFLLVSLVIMASMVLAACGPAATPAATLPTAAVPLPAGVTLAQKNHLLICTDFPYPPQEFFD